MEENKEEFSRQSQPEGVSPPPPPPVSQQAPSAGDIEKELIRLRSRNKILKAATIVLTTLFLLVGGAVMFIYHKVSGFRDMLMPPTETFQETAFGMDEAPPSSGTEGELLFSTQPASGSSLAMFPGSDEYLQEQEKEAGGGEAAGAKAADALMKYADRPIVKDFIAAAKKDPAFARALKNSDPENPLSVFSSIQNVKSVQNLAMRFAMRKDFLPLMMEVTSDPDIKPLLGRLPMGNLGGMVRKLQSMSGAAGGKPRSKASTGAMTAAPVPGDDGSGDETDMDEPVLTPSEPRTAPIKKNNVPPPVD